MCFLSISLRVIVKFELNFLKTIFPFTRQKNMVALTELTVQKCESIKSFILLMFVSYSRVPFDFTKRLKLSKNPHGTILNISCPTDSCSCKFLV